MERFWRKAGETFKAFDLAQAAFPIVSLQALDDLLRRLKIIQQVVDKILKTTVVSTRLRRLVSLERLVQQCIRKTRAHLRKLPKASSTRPATSSQKSQFGRPTITLTQSELDDIVNLKKAGNSWKRIAETAGMSRQTLWRLHKKTAEEADPTHTLMSCATLRSHLRQFVREHPHSGAILALGWLRARGFFVQRKRVRQVLSEIDPAGVAARSLAIVRRKIYSVRGANSLWHQDANMKLEPWGFMIHGCIDGFSRLVTYLKVANNKRDTTVLGYFKTAKMRYGLPSRVRGDYGKENFGIKAYMEKKRGIEHHPYLAGRSIHNVRIERLWVDVWRSVSRKYHRVFTRLTTGGFFNPNERLHRAVLYLVFQPRIQASCDSFVVSWNHHSVSTESGQSPYALFSLSRYRARREGWADNPGDRADLIRQAHYGIDPFRPVSEGDAIALDRRFEQIGAARLGRAACSDAELLAAQELLEGFHLEGQSYDQGDDGEDMFIAAVQYAERAAERWSQT